MSTIHKYEVTKGLRTVASSLAPVADVRELSANGHVEIDATVPGNSTDEEVSVAFPVAGVKALALQSTVAMTIKTNDSAEPDNTLVLKPGVQYAWDEDSYDDLKFTEDVTKFFVTVPGATAGVLSVRCLYDSTPEE